MSNLDTVIVVFFIIFGWELSNAFWKWIFKHRHQWVTIDKDKWDSVLQEKGAGPDIIINLKEKYQFGRYCQKCERCEFISYDLEGILTGKISIYTK